VNIAEGIFVAGRGPDSKGIVEGSGRNVGEGIFAAGRGPNGKRIVEGSGRIGRRNSGKSPRHPSCARLFFLVGWPVFAKATPTMNTNEEPAADQPLLMLMVAIVVLIVTGFIMGRWSSTGASTAEPSRVEWVEADQGVRQPLEPDTALFMPRGCDVPPPAWGERQDLQSFHTRDIPPPAQREESPSESLMPGIGRHEQQHRQRTVTTQCPVTYKRRLTQPRFQPLAHDEHGCWPEP
jgi:hypothetical protein